MSLSTLGLDAVAFEVPAPKQPQRLPEILSREEMARLIAAPVRLRVRDVDSRQPAVPRSLPGTPNSQSLPTPALHTAFNSA